ncbi:MAG: AhpC/TSA family protein [Bacteroidales bacterium]|nr:AhpC/TSA family protein [Bacteroidales bacterium]
MKKMIFAALMCAAILTSCTGGSYTINGTLHVPDGVELYLVDLVADDTLSVTKVADSQFTFAGELEKATYVYLGQGRNRVRFILEPGTVSVDLDQRIPSGTPLLDESNEYQARIKEISSQRMAEIREKGLIKGGGIVPGAEPQIDSIFAFYRDIQLAFADSVLLAHKRDLLGALALSDLYGCDTALFARRYAIVSKDVREFPPIAQAYERQQQFYKTQEGEMFTDFTVEGGNADGSDAHLSDYVGHGKYTLVNFWSSWSRPCRLVYPYLRASLRIFDSEKFEVIGVAVGDRRENSLNAIEEYELSWPQILDAKDIPLNTYSFTAIPYTILFGPDGTILRRGLRNEDILDAVEEALLVE